MRLISSSIVILAGAIAGISGNRDVNSFGMLAICIGGVFFIVSFFQSLKTNRSQEG